MIKMFVIDGRCKVYKKLMSFFYHSTVFHQATLLSVVRICYKPIDKTMVMYRKSNIRYQLLISL